MNKSTLSKLRTLVVLLSLTTAAVVSSQSITTKHRFHLDKIPLEKRLECQEQNGCFVLTTDELLSALKAAYLAGQKSNNKE